VCSVIAAFVLLVWASVADDMVPAGSRVIALGLMHCSLSALSLPNPSRVAGHGPVPFCSALGAAATAPLGCGMVSDLNLFFEEVQELLWSHDSRCSKTNSSHCIMALTQHDMSTKNVSIL
jgi:hypothetical protein